MPARRAGPNFDAPPEGPSRRTAPRCDAPFWTLRRPSFRESWWGRRPVRRTADKMPAPQPGRREEGASGSLREVRREGGPSRRVGRGRGTVERPRSAVRRTSRRGTVGTRGGRRSVRSAVPTRSVGTSRSWWGRRPACAGCGRQDACPTAAAKRKTDAGAAKTGHPDGGPSGWGGPYPTMADGLRAGMRLGRWASILRIAVGS